MKIVLIIIFVETIVLFFFFWFSQTEMDILLLCWSTHYLGAHGSPEIVAFMSLIIGALLDLFRFDGQSTSILTTEASLTDMTAVVAGAAVSG